MKNRDRILAVCNRHNLIPQATVALAEEIIAIIKESDSPKLRSYQQKAIDDLRESFKKPQLIQGYTAEQWQEIIDGGYLCSFSNGTSFSHGVMGLMYGFHFDSDEKCYYFCQEKDRTNEYQFCRPAQIKGVMRPIFVEPVDDPYCVFFDVDGKAMHHGMMRWSLHCEYNFKAFNCDRLPTKYIEL